jgi:hypothetical protein
MLPWFRFYVEFLHDYKIKKLSEIMRLRLVELWCLCAPLGGIVPSEAEVACQLRIPAQEAKDVIKHLIEQGFIDEITQRYENTVTRYENTVTLPEKILCIHGWKKRQFISDDVAKRMRKYRKNKKKANGTALRNALRNGDVTRYVTVTSPDTDTDSDVDSKKERKKESVYVAVATNTRQFFPDQGGQSLEVETLAPRAASSPTPSRKAAKRSSERGTLCPEDFKPSGKHYAYGAKFEFNPAQVDEICQDMINWSLENAAKKVRWDLTLNNFIRNRYERLNPPKRKINGKDAIL